MKVCIIIPAYNEENRIARTLNAYDDFFTQKHKETNLVYELLVVINGTTDNTAQIVHALQLQRSVIKSIEIKEGGKGLAITTGFKEVLHDTFDLIGFVDADMATSPETFYDLIKNLDGNDGIIASRYMPGAQITPARPFIKRWGSRLFYESLVWLLFGLSYYDFQCGAKLFKVAVIKKITPYLSVKQWAFDIELLYLCKRFGFSVKEIPTVWHDQAGSKLKVMRAGSRMIGALVAMRWRYFYQNLQ
jgi:glycosyltransferase involved in cell wall biosynthesis